MCVPSTISLFSTLFIVDSYIMDMLVVGVHFSLSLWFLINFVCRTNSKSLKLLIEINDSDLFKGLGICKLGTQGETKKCSEEERKVKSFYSKKYILRIINSAFLALDWSKMVISQMPGSQDDRSGRSGHVRVVWTVVVRCIWTVPQGVNRWPGDMNLSGDN